MTKTKGLALMALFAALTAVLSQIIIPLPFTPVPISLATLSVFVAGGLLGAARGGISQLIYVFLGILGLPVFAGLSGGFAIVAGPRGGYILGYALMAFLIGLIRTKLPRLGTIFAIVVSLLFFYALATIWFSFVTGTRFITAVAECVLPFLIGDGLKIWVAVMVIKRLRALYGL